MERNMLAVLGAIALLVNFALSEKVIDINADVDKALILMNKKLTEAGAGLEKLPDFRLPRVRFSKGVQYGINSLNRTRDCTLTLNDDGSVYQDYHVGYRLLALAFGKIALKNGDQLSGATRINTNSVHISYLLTGVPHNCTVHLCHYEFEKMTDADFQASIPRYDGRDASAFFSRVFLPYINQELRKIRGKVEKMLQKQICPKDGKGIILADILPKPLKLFVGFNVFSKLEDQQESDIEESLISEDSIF